MRVRALLFVLVAGALSGCGGEETGEGRAPTGASGRPAENVSHGEPSGTLFLRNVRDETLVVVDVERGETTRIAIPKLGAGDPPFHLVETGGKLVFYGSDGTYALDLELKRPPKKLGDASYFVPSATEGRVWLALLDPRSPDTERDLRGVREVTVAGRTTVPETGPPPCGGPTIVAAVRDGLLCQEDGLRVWDPVTGELIRTLPGPFVAATYANLVAWCDDGCGTFHVTDIRTGDDIVISPERSFIFESTYDGAFSPDGSLLALPVVIGGANQAHGTAGHRHGVALVDVEKRHASVIEGSTLDADYPALTWSRSGEWLFFSAGEGRIFAHRPRSGETVLLPVAVEQSFVDMAAD